MAGLTQGRASPKPPFVAPFAESQLHQGEESAARSWALGAAALLAALATIRLTLLFASGLELYPDEAQYWAWSRRLAWGYFSKPPMIAWLIRLTTAVGGDDEAWVRLPALACQTAAGGFVFLAARRLWDSRAGFLAAAAYAFAPGIALSSAVASTDAPLLMFVAAALWAYAAVLRGRSFAASAALGLCLGLAMLSKYAALYAVGALILHALLSRQAREAWGLPRPLVAGAAAAAVMAPNLIWNATHGFETVSHTASNANWRVGALFNPGEVLDFATAQFALVGPVMMVLLGLAVVGVLLRRRGADTAETGLVVLVVTPLAIVAAQAFLSRANANWAAAFVPPAAVLLGGALARWTRLGSPEARWAWLGLGLALVSQAAVVAALSSAAVSPAVAAALRLDNGLKRARGWSATAEAVRGRAAAESWSEPLTGIAVDDRFVYYALTYYGRNWLGRPGAPPLTAWVREASAQNEAEATRPLTAANGARVLAVSAVPDYTNDFVAAFQAAERLGPISVPLDQRRRRELTMFVGRGFRPAAPRPSPTRP